MNKRKVLNDPVYGFISIPTELIYDLVEHPWFQRLRRIKQLGLTEYVYPGALHTRFHHALGAVHLMNIALQNLRDKGVEISDQEMEAAFVAILLHDIGHGPFSHTLESILFEGMHHENLSLHLMKRLNEEFNGALELGIQIFENTYSRKFFHQLVSGQLDIDRLDYLQRDCFFTGVSEGAIGADRIIKMLDVVNDQLVVEEKGIYSIENFLNARRLMYWQVYMHKTSVSVEQMLILVFTRIKHLLSEGVQLPIPDHLKKILSLTSINQTAISPEVTQAFVSLDDHDVWYVVKLLQRSEDVVLKEICSRLINRKLFKLELSNEPFSQSHIATIKKQIEGTFNEDSGFYVSKGQLTNEAYVSKGKKIYIYSKKGEVKDIADASELPNIKAISKIVKKYFLCYPKNVSLYTH